MVPSPAQDAGQAASAAVEKIGVHSIRVVEPRARSTAVVGTFGAADRMLRGWAKRLDGELDCQFVIVYTDGETVSGDFRFRAKGTKAPSLGRFLRSSVALAEVGVLAAVALHGPLSRSFLAGYETGDG